MKCSFPDCKVTATKLWALVPLCEGHHETIEAETDKFYHGRDGRPEKVKRPLYTQIDHLVPCSKRNMKQGDWGK